MGRVRAFYGNFGMFVRALAYILANGPDGLRQTTEDAVLNANYIRKGLEGVYDLPYSTPSMHEVVFSDKVQAKKGVRTMDIAKRLIDYGFHPYTTAFPLIVPGALMIEPTESESKEEMDLFIEAMKSIARGSGRRSADGARCAALHASLAPRRNGRCAQAGAAVETLEGPRKVLQPQRTLRTGETNVGGSPARPLIVSSVIVCVSSVSSVVICL